MRKKRLQNNKGFTLAELIVAMAVTAIIFSALSTLAFALSSANSSTRAMGEKQDQLRLATFRLTDLIKSAALVRSTVNGAGLWVDINGDSAGIAGEVYFLEYDAGNDVFKMIHFAGLTNSISLTDFANDTDNLKAWLINNYSESTIVLVSDCTSATVSVTSNTFVNISLDITEDSGTWNYQIDAAVRCSGAHLL